MRSHLIPIAVAAPLAFVAPSHVARAQDVAPVAQTTVVSVAGREGMMAAGTADGVRVGAVYEVVRDGKTVALATVSRVYAARSYVRFSEVVDGFVVTVGDGARFLRVDAAPVVPVVPVAPPVAPVIVAPVAPAPMTPIAPAPVVPATPMATDSGMTLVPTVRRTAPLVSAVNGETVEIGAGSTSGLSTGKTVSIVRAGNVVAIVRLNSVTPTGASGTVLWRDDAAGALRAGDAIQVAAGSPGEDLVEPETGAKPVPAARVRFETGASGVVVPKNHRTYDYLASLAADRLITSQPAWVFHDEGTRRHRTEEDITFTQAEIAGFVREALASPYIDGAKGRSRIALGNLISMYRRDVQLQGASEEQLAAFGSRKGFEIGFSGQSRASLTTVTGPGPYLEAFGERNGSFRSRSGFDSRNNIFGRVGENLSFDAQIDGGSDRRENGNDRNYAVRRAVVSYKADRLLRGLTVDLGRQEFWWGPGHYGTLLLSDAAGPLNSMRTVFKRGSYSFESVYSPLGGGVGGQGRALYAQKLELRASPQTRVGLSMSVMSPKEAFDPLLFASTFSPIPIAIAQRATKESSFADQSNLLTSAYFETSLARGFTGYGEILLDDIAFTDESRARQRVGTIIGGHLFKPNDPGKIGLRAEYANLNGRTYLRFQNPSPLTPDYDYYYRGSPLGYPIAPTQGSLSPLVPGGTTGLGGASSLRVEFNWRPRPKLHLGTGFEIADINSEFSTISRQQIFRYKLAYNVRRNYTVVARLQRISTTNPGFIPTGTLRQNVYQLELVRTF